VEGRVLIVASDQKRVVLGLGSEAVRRRERCRKVGSGFGTGGGGPDEVMGRAVALELGLVWIRHVDVIDGSRRLCSEVLLGWLVNLASLNDWRYICDDAVLLIVVELECNIEGIKMQRLLPQLKICKM